MSIDYYVLTDGERFITRNKAGSYIPEHDIAKALVLTKSEAERIYSNHLSKPLRKIFYMSKRTLPMIETSEIMDGALHETSGYVDADYSDRCDGETITPLAKHYDVDYDMDDKFIQEIKGVINIFKMAPNKKNEISNRLERIEKEIVDIYHYIEFNTLNASDGYAAYKMLRERLKNRRKLKNELKVVDVLTKSIFTASDIVDLEKTITSFETNKYSPRVMKELFEKK